MSRIQVTWDDKTYTYDPDKITIRQAIMIKEHTGGLGLMSWQRAVNDIDPQAVQALLWVIKEQNGELAPIASLQFNPMQFINAFAVDGAVPDKESGDPVDPTPGDTDPIPG